MSLLVNLPHSWLTAVTLSGKKKKKKKNSTLSSTIDYSQKDQLYSLVRKKFHKGRAVNS